jgi:hypothetical protein
MSPSTVELEAIIEAGQCVYSVSWDTDSPFGGSGCERVYTLNGAYAVAFDEGERSGPYSTLCDAISATEELYLVGPATIEIESKELNIDEIISLLKPFEDVDEPELKIRINGEIRTIQSS